MKTITFADNKTRLEYVDALLLERDHFQDAERRTLTIKFANVESLDYLRGLFADPFMTSSIVLANDEVPVYDKDGRLVALKTVKHEYSRFTLYSPPAGTLVAPEPREEGAAALFEEHYAFRLGQKTIKDDLEDQIGALLQILSFDESRPVREVVMEYERAVACAANRLTDEEARECAVLFPRWQRDQHYNRAARVRFQGKLYQCEKTHESDALEPEKQPEIWRLLE